MKLRGSRIAARSAAARKPAVRRHQTARAEPIRVTLSGDVSTYTIDGRKWVSGMATLAIVGLVSIIAGIGLGYVLAGRTDRPNKRSTRLEAELEAAQREHDQYRDTVLEQFTGTAARFQQLNDAYLGLHAQLAESAQRLCGNEIAEMIEAPKKSHREESLRIEDRKDEAIQKTTSKRAAAGGLSAGATAAADETEPSSRSGETSDDDGSRQDDETPGETIRREREEARNRADGLMGSEVRDGGRSTHPQGADDESEAEKRRHEATG